MIKGLNSSSVDNYLTFIKNVESYDFSFLLLTKFTEIEKKEIVIRLLNLKNSYVIYCDSIDEIIKKYREQITNWDFSFTCDKNLIVLILSRVVKNECVVCLEECKKLLTNKFNCDCKYTCCKLCFNKLASCIYCKNTHLCENKLLESLPTAYRGIISLITDATYLDDYVITVIDNVYRVTFTSVQREPLNFLVLKNSQRQQYFKKAIYNTLYSFPYSFFLPFFKSSVNEDVFRSIILHKENANSVIRTLIRDFDSFVEKVIQEKSYLELIRPIDRREVVYKGVYIYKI